MKERPDRSIRDSDGQCQRTVVTNKNKKQTPWIPCNSATIGADVVELTILVLDKTQPLSPRNESVGSQTQPRHLSRSVLSV